MWDLATLVARNEEASRLWREGKSIRPAQAAIEIDRKKQEANLLAQRVSALKAELGERDLAILEGRASLS